MEKLFSSFSIELLLRSFFAGLFFLLSFDIASRGIERFEKIATSTILPSTDAKIGLLFKATVIGFFLYGIHRSVIYPFIELLFSSKCGSKFCGSSQIEQKPDSDGLADRVFESIRELWDMQVSCDDCPNPNRSLHIRSWANWIHQQYVSAWAIVAGAVAHAWIKFKIASVCYPLLSMCAVLLFAAIYSDVRLRRMRNHLKKKQKNAWAEQHGTHQRQKSDR